MAKYSMELQMYRAKTKQTLKRGFWGWWRHEVILSI